MRDMERFTARGARAITERDWTAYGRLFSKDLVMRAPGIQGVTRGREARVRFV